MVLLLRVFFLRNCQVCTLVNWLTVSTSVSTSGWEDSINVRTLQYQYLVNIIWHMMKTSNACRETEVSEEDRRTADSASSGQTGLWILKGPRSRLPGRGSRVQCGTYVRNATELVQYQFPRKSTKTLPRTPRYRNRGDYAIGSLFLAFFWEFFMPSFHFTGS